MRNRIFAESQTQSTCPQDNYHYKGNGNSVEEERGRQGLKEGLGFTTTSSKNSSVLFLPPHAPRRAQRHGCSILAKHAQPEFNHEETPDKPTLRNILQNNWPVLFKTSRTGRARRD